MNGHVSCIFLRAHTSLSLSPSLTLSIYICVCVSTCADMHIHMHIDKQPGGWETALAVKHFLKKTLLAPWRRAHFMMNITLNFPGENSMTLKEWRSVYMYLQGFVLLAGWSLFPCSLGVSLLQAFAQSVAGETEEVCAISMLPSPLPHPNSLKQLRVHSTIFTCAPGGCYCTFGNFPHSIDTTRCALASCPMSFSC